MRILVFAPHPDDEIIGCGGYLAKLISKGNCVDVAYLITPEERRLHELMTVKEFMGFDQVYLLNQGKGRFINKNKDLFGKILRSIRTSNPSLIMIPHKHEQDKDHSFLNEIVTECAYLCESDFLLEKNQKPTSIDIIIGYETWTPIQSPALYVDITDFMSKKRGAMMLYESQKYKDFVSMFDGLNQYRGALSGRGKFVEAFDIYKIPDSNIVYNQKNKRNDKN
ncbi:MAG: PIG-L family deacetylase [Nanoarchaeota archaeon]|nr:PIG-L family deacetylase [Nanoarchaeota archaeon]